MAVSGGHECGPSVRYLVDQRLKERESESKRAQYEVAIKMFQFIRKAEMISDLKSP